MHEHLSTTAGISHENLNDTFLHAMNQFINNEILHMFLKSTCNIVIKFNICCLQITSIYPLNKMFLLLSAAGAKSNSTSGTDRLAVELLGTLS
jgi:hypothetical protein